MSTDWTQRHVLVTGGGGFFGSHLVEELLRRGAKVRVLVRRESPYLDATNTNLEVVQGDMFDPEACKAALQDIDFLFHAASFRKNILYHREHADEVQATNIGLSSALIDALSGAYIPTVVFSSANIPTDFDVAAARGNAERDGYVLGKVLADQLWLSEAERNDFPLLIVRATSIYGPRDRFAADANVLPAFIIRAQEAEDELQIWGSGKQQRSFVYVQDLVAAVLELIDADARGVEYVVPPEVISMLELAEMICQKVRPDIRVTCDVSKPEGPPRPPDAPLHSCLQNFPWTPLSSGIQATIHWLQS